MANYNLVINSRFKPFSFERYIQPYQMYEKAYKENEEVATQLLEKASVWEKMADSQRDRQAYEQYKKYSDDLKSAAEQLSKEGLNAKNRNAIISMRPRYASEIVPIEQAYKAREEEIKAQYEGRAKGIVYEGDASESSLNRYLNNPGIKYKYANSVEGLNRLGLAAKALSNGVVRDKNGYKLDNYTKVWLQKHGYTDNEVKAAIDDIQKIIQGDTNVQTNGVLRALLNDELKASGVDSWENIDAKNQYFNKVAPALYQAIGETKATTYEDFGTREALRHSHAMQEATQANPNLTNKPIKINDPNLTDLYSASEISKRNREILKKYESYRKMGYINSKGQLTRRGEKALMAEREQILKGKNIRSINTTSPTTLMPYYFGTEDTTQSEDTTQFIKFLDNIGYKNYMNYSNKDVSTLNKLFGKVRQVYIGADTSVPLGDLNIKVSRIKVNEAQSKDIADQMASVIGKDMTISSAGRIEETPDKQFKVNITSSNANQLTWQDLYQLAKDGKIEGKGRISYIINSPTSGQQMFQMSDGTRYILPKSIFSDSQIAKLNAANMAATASTNAQETAESLTYGTTYLSGILNSNSGQDIEWPESGSDIIYGGTEDE